MESKSKKNDPIENFIHFAIGNDQLIVTKVDDLYINIRGSIDGNKFIFPMEFKTKKLRDDSFNIFSIKRAKQVIFYLKSGNEEE